MSQPTTTSATPASTSSMPPGVTDPNYHPEPGRLGNLSVAQQAALDQLKAELQAEGHFVPERMTDQMLLRFLRARKFDVALSKKMLLAHEKWRVDFGVDDIVKNFNYTEHKQVNKYYPQYYHKTDKDGRPIYIERLGQLDIKALYACTTQERQLKRLVGEYERCVNERFPQCSAASGRPIETSCTIMDLNNVSLTNFYKVKDYVMAAASIGQNQYPESMGNFYIVNAPWAFTAVWAIIKPWLDEVTVRKIDIVGSAYVKDKLLAQIPKENLPKEFGGECSCPGGCSLSDAGPWNSQPDTNGEAGQA